jgi:hypothetical protein
MRAHESEVDLGRPRACVRAWVSQFFFPRWLMMDEARELRPDTPYVQTSGRIPSINFFLFYLYTRHLDTSQHFKKDPKKQKDSKNL